MMPDDQTGGSIGDRTGTNESPQETVLAGAPDGAPYADDSSSGKDLGNAAAIAGYSDGGARGATPDIEGFASGATGSKDEVISTSGNGGADNANPLVGADPSRNVDQSTSMDNNPGGDVLEDDAMADQGGIKNA